MTAFNQRFSEVITKFDYIGDWSNEQLRLRGFYKDDRTEEKSEKISRLQDYLLEYCSYGCAYFVLENEAPKRASFDKKCERRKKKPSRKERNRLKQTKTECREENRRRQKDQHSQKEDKGNVICHSSEVSRE